MNREVSVERRANRVESDRWEWGKGRLLDILSQLLYSSYNFSVFDITSKKKKLKKKWDTRLPPRVAVETLLWRSLFSLLNT